MMPERVRTVNNLVTNVIGTQVWDGRIGEPVDITIEHYDEVRAACDELFARVVHSIDWARALLTAQGRCLALGHQHTLGDQLCGQSMAHALLADQTFMRWADNEADPPEPMTYTDWPTRIAAALELRRRGGHAGWVAPNGAVS